MDRRLFLHGFAKEGTWSFISSVLTLFKTPENSLKSTKKTELEIQTRQILSYICVDCICSLRKSVNLNVVVKT